MVFPSRNYASELKEGWNSEQYFSLLPGDPFQELLLRQSASQEVAWCFEIARALGSVPRQFPTLPAVGGV